MFHHRIHNALARERTRDLAGGAAVEEHVTIRRARMDDAAALRRLAELDGHRSISGPALLAEVDGEVRAALPLDGSAPVADPFRRTAPLVSLLSVRARQLA